MDALVTTEWLADELGAHDLRLVDATYFGSVPGAPGGDARQRFEAAHIPGAVFLDLEALADTTSELPSMLPSPEAFAERIASLGIGDGDRIVLYDVSHYHTATRAWWMLRAFGVRDVAILDGGLAKWQAEGRAVENGTAQPARATFTARFDRHRVRTLDQMKANAVNPGEQMLDARSPARFSGEEPDPRPGTGAGHIPGSKNLPYGRLLNPDGTWKTATALKAEFDAAGIDLAKPLVTTCGSGITAAVLAFGAHLLGGGAALYDGSWSEWGADPTTPKATGTA
ncbi:3-mercaptopyruvate sulfurtransferase [Sphingomonas bacterium]|uniref:3-mercaptopyruvate sulfurtransferase n=1 Tax=Sphingomonas bacterium TaxID=1895847 RepID=UPI00260BCB87|nr:3-mercaptopyruvate sulfurtransferase [Sphingomonas bacterium]MDB5679663.1 3-mercaptopyruvate sulfurtransferase [Sphingomonas bacterium]